MYITQNIKYLRKKNKFSQEVLGSKLGLTKSAVSAYEKGVNEPSLTMVAKIAKIFDVKVDDLFFTDLSQPNDEVPDPRMKKSGYEYAQDIENDRMTVDEVTNEIGEENIENKVNRFMELRINELERAIKEIDPDMAKKLMID